MNPKVKRLEYKLTENLKLIVLLTPSSRKFYISYKMFALNKLCNLVESLLFSPSLNSSNFGAKSSSSLYRNIFNEADYYVSDILGEVIEKKI